MSHSYGVSSSGVRLSWNTVLTAAVVAIAGGGLTSLVAARHVSRLKPAHTLRS